MLLTGVEVSLWLAEQFAADLKTLLPGLRVAAIRWVVRRAGNGCQGGPAGGRLLASQACLPATLEPSPRPPSLHRGATPSFSQSLPRSLAAPTK